MDDAVYRSIERDDVPEPLAMSVATIDAAGRPDVRTNAASPDPLLISGRFAQLRPLEGTEFSSETGLK